MRAHHPETAACGPQKEDTTKPVTSTEVDGYRPWLTPGNLIRILAMGQSSTDLIHTGKHAGLSGVSGSVTPRRTLGREAPAWAGTARARSGAFGQRTATGQVRNHGGSPYLWFKIHQEGLGGRPGSQPERPTERASSKARDRTTRGVRALRGLKRREKARIRPRSLVEGETRNAIPTARMQAASRTGGEGTAGFVDP